MRFIFLALAFISLSGDLLAQERVEAWSRVSLTSADWIPKSVVQVEFQYRDQYLTRFQELDQKTYSIRPWIRKQIGDRGVYIQSSPIAYFFRATASTQKKSTLSEWRVTQHVGYQFPTFPLELRGGVEFRRFHGETRLNEFRYRGRVQILLRKKGQLQPKISVEYFYRHGREERTFDQFRAMAGIFKTWEKLDFEVGYQHHTRQNILLKKNNSNIIYIHLTPKI